MNLVYVIARFHPFKGGAEQNCYQLARRAAADGHNVTILTTDVSPPNYKGEMPAEETVDDMKIIRVHAWNKQLNLGFYPQMLPSLHKIDADVVHVCNGAGFIWRDICLFVKKVSSAKTKFIITPHGPFLATPQTHGGLKGMVALVAKYLITPYLLLWAKLFDQFIAVNPNQNKWLKKDYWVADRISLIGNGIDADFISHQMPTKTDHTLNIAYLGRLEKYKGVQNIIAALKSIKSENSDLKMQLKIMGQGVYEDDLRKMVQEAKLAREVTFIINPQDQIRDQVLENSDVLVLVSDWEATGIVLIEAMAKGNAIITNQQNEAADLLINNSDVGFIVKNSNELADRLIKLASDYKLKNEMQSTAWAKSKQFTWDSIYQSYRALLSNLNT